jgi:hypothetical protein
LEIPSRFDSSSTRASKTGSNRTESATETSYVSAYYMNTSACRFLQSAVAETSLVEQTDPRSVSKMMPCGMSGRANAEDFQSSRNCGTRP